MKLESLPTTVAGAPTSQEFLLFLPPEPKLKDLLSVSGLMNCCLGSRPSLVPEKQGKAHSVFSGEAQTKAKGMDVDTEL